MYEPVTKTAAQPQIPPNPEKKLYWSWKQTQRLQDVYFLTS